MRNRLIDISLHFVAWVFVIVYFEFFLGFEIEYVVEGADFSYTANIKALSPATFIGIGLFYLNALFLAPKYLFGQKRQAFIAYILIAVLIALTLQSIIHFFDAEVFNLPFIDFYVYELLGNRSVLMLVIFVIPSFVYSYYHQNLKMEIQKRSILSEKLNSELTFLRSQINPHFLFNTLNNLFAMAKEQGNEEIASYILKLSGQLRYAVYDSNTPTVRLWDDLFFIKNYLDLYKLGLSHSNDGSNIKFESNVQEDSPLKIAPMLLIPFVENALKFGLGKKKEGEINILCDLQGRKLNFEIKNTIMPKGDLDKTGGVGLINVKKRLELIYPNDHQLKINDDGAIFEVKLAINLD